MWYFWVILAMLAILGGLFMLLRTANTPKIPEKFKHRQSDDDFTGE